MNNFTTSFLITFIAGISTILGIIPTYINQKYQKNIISFSLFFAAIVMLIISFTSLIGEALKYLNIIVVLIFTNIGIIISTYIDQKLDKRITNNSLLKVGIVTIIALILHNIPEGITTFITTSNNIRVGIKLAIAISLHNIPEGISIAVPIYYATKSHKKAFIYVAIAGFSELFGAIISYLFLKDIITPYLLAIILAITAGIMIQIALFSLLPTVLKKEDY